MLQLYVDFYESTLGKLNGIAHNIEQDLPEALWTTCDEFRYLAVEFNI